MDRFVDCGPWVDKFSHELWYEEAMAEASDA